jgi:hypothetical protein
MLEELLSYRAKLIEDIHWLQTSQKEVPIGGVWHPKLATGIRNCNICLRTIDIVRTRKSDKREIIKDAIVTCDLMIKTVKILKEKFQTTFPNDRS